MSKKRPVANVTKELDKEKEELDDKIMKLDNFIRSIGFVTLSEYHQYKMRLQSQAMTSYSMILRDRIMDITPQEN